MKWYVRRDDDDDEREFGLKYGNAEDAAEYAAKLDHTEWAWEGSLTDYWPCIYHVRRGGDETTVKVEVDADYDVLFYSEEIE